MATSAQVQAGQNGAAGTGDTNQKAGASNNSEEITSSNIAMEQEAPAAQANGFDRLNEETIEGLSNLAHGLPHDQFDPQKGHWSGDGFPGFTGENANLIGAPFMRLTADIKICYCYSKEIRI